MKSAEEFIKDFMNELNDGKLLVDREPYENGAKITEKYIKNIISEYNNLLNNDFYKKIIMEEEIDSNRLVLEPNIKK